MNVINACFAQGRRRQDHADRPSRRLCPYMTAPMPGHRRLPKPAKLGRKPSSICGRSWRRSVISPVPGA